MFRKILKAYARRSAQRSAGFAMPLTLAVLLILSYIIAISLQRVEVSRAEARLASATLDDILDSTLVEQDVLWRSLLEILTRQVTGTGVAIYGARPPENAWAPTARAFLWSPTYGALVDENFPTALVVIHDEASKIDLNNPSEGYLRLIAVRAGLGSGSADRAVRELQAYINERTPVAIGADEFLRFPQRSGLIDPLEICALSSWSRWELCSRPEALRELATADVGLVPNIRMMTPENAEFLLGEPPGFDITEVETQWRELRITYGFYNPLQGIGTGGQRFTVTIIPRSAQRAFRFEIDTRVQETGHPFAIRNRRYLPADAILQDYRRRFPGVVSAFLNQ